MKHINASKKKLVLLVPIAIVAAMILLALPSTFGPSANAEGEVKYLDVKGDEQYKNLVDVTELNQAYFSTAPYELYDGWYYVTGNINLTGPIMTFGDVNIVIGDGFTLKVTYAAGAAVVVEGNLSVFGQSVGDTQGILLAATGQAVLVNQDSGFTNTATIKSSGYGVYSVAPGGTDTQGITVTNGVTGTITSSGNSGIRAGAYMDITNRGTIYGHSGVTFGDCGGKITNSGRIEGKGFTGSGIITSSNVVTVINEASGIIYHYNYTGILFYGDGIVYNYGWIEGDGVGIAFETSSGQIYNYGTITSPKGYAVSRFSGNDTSIVVDLVLVNAGTIRNFSLLGSTTLDLTFMVGSKSTGTYKISSTAGTKLTFSGDPGAALLYAVSSGNNNLGDITVGIDPVGLPATLLVGDKIVLLDGNYAGRTMTGNVLNPVLTVCCYTLVISIEDNQLIAVVTGITDTKPPEPPEPPVPPEPPEPPGGGGGGGEQPERYHYIVATAGSGATINPMGEVKVVKGGNKIFYFSALAVYVDGVPLSQAEVDLGYYKFINVNANHDIYAVGHDGSRDVIYLTIDIKQGKGHAGFTLNGLTYTDYTGPVPLQYGVNLVVSACPDYGYSFKEWRYDGKVLTDNAQTLNNVTSSIHLDLYFTENRSIGDIFDNDGGFPWLLVSIIILLASGFILWIVFFYRRYYDVVKPGNGRVIGNDKAHRKSEYEFTVEGRFSGKAVFRIGDDGEWTTVQPGPERKYVIPKGLIVDTVTIELR
jgi:hypothetical protein